MFESINLTEFGIYIKKLRHSLGFTQKDIEKLSGISVDSIRRIENGTVLLRYDTLVYLSVALKKDLYLDLRNYRNSGDLYDYYKRLNKLIFDYNIDLLKDLKSDFMNFSNKNTQKTYINNKVRDQFVALLEGISELNNGNPLKGQKYFIEAMCLTNTNFKIDNYKTYKYTYFETRILLLISIAMANNNDFQGSNQLLRSCLDFCNFEAEADIYEKNLIANIYYNISYNYHKIDNNYECLKYAELGIQYCNANLIVYTLPALLFRKGIAQLSLTDSEANKTLMRSIVLLKITGNDELAELYNNTLNKIYNIDLDISNL